MLCYILNFLIIGCNWRQFSNIWRFVYYFLCLIELLFFFIRSKSIPLFSFIIWISWNWFWLYFLLRLIFRNIFGLDFRYLLDLLFFYIFPFKRSLRNYIRSYRFEWSFNWKNIFAQLRNLIHILIFNYKTFKTI